MKFQHSSKNGTETRADSSKTADLRTWKKGYDISLDQVVECPSSTQTLEATVK